MASIQPHGAGFRVHYTKDGAKRKSPSFPTREGAEAWMRDNLSALTARHFLELVEVWRQEEPSDHRSEAALRLSAAARQRGWHDIQRIDLGELRAWQRECKVPRYGQYLATVLRWAASSHGLPVRPEVLAWRPGTYARKPPVALLTDLQVGLIRDCAASMGERAYAIVDYLLSYGARPITACRLRLSDLDLSRGELVISDAKHSGGWRHALHQRHVDGWPGLTAGWLHEPAPVGTAEVPIFPHYREDRPWKLERGSARELTNWYKNTIGKKLKLGAQSGIYHLKRHAITSMLRSGIDAATVALFTGHLDLEQVLTYAKSNADTQRNALSLMPVPTEVPRFPSVAL